jgi:hypothetical protein
MPRADPDLAELGAFFSVRRAVEPGSWRPLRDLLDEAVLTERVRHVHAALGRLAGVEVEPRVAASTMSLGLFARLVSPVLGAAVLAVPLPRPTLDRTWWQPVDQGPWPLALTGPDTEPRLADLVTDVLAPLTEVLARTFSLSRRVLSGNAASAVFGAAGMVGAARPELAAAAREAGAALLTGPLESTGELRAGGFVRSSCCLYYRIPGGGYCGDCVLAG